MKELEQELQEESALRQQAEEASKLAKGEVEKLQGELSTLRQSMEEKSAAVAAENAKAILSYKNILASFGSDAAPPADGDAVQLATWLAEELSTFGDRVDTARAFASLASLRAFAQAVLDVGWTSFDSIEPKEVDSYWAVLAEAGEAASRFHDAFWYAGGRDIALLRAALLGAETEEQKREITAKVKGFVALRDGRGGSGLRTLSTPQDSAAASPNEGRGSGQGNDGVDA